MEARIMEYYDDTAKVAVKMPNGVGAYAILGALRAIVDTPEYTDATKVEHAKYLLDKFREERQKQEEEAG